MIGSIKTITYDKLSEKKSVGHLPVHYNKKPTAYMREYILDHEPGGYCFPFGFGLSYTTFEYSNFILENDIVGRHDTIKLSVDVENIGDIERAEIVQVYIHDQIASVTRPMKELKAFDKIYLKKGEKKNVTLNIPVQKLAFYNKEMKL